MTRAGNHGRFARDERGLAGAIGIVLMLAVAVTVYAQTVQVKMPIYGEAAEHAWDEAVGAAFFSIGRSLAGGLENVGPTTVTIPSPTEPKSIDIPFLGSKAPAPPSGSVHFTPSCTKVTASHKTAAGQTVNDLLRRTMGCLVFEAHPIYSPSFGYVVENGGVLRVQGGRAIVLTSPPIGLEATSPAEYRLSLGLVGLRGNAVAASNDGSAVHVDVIPGAFTAEVEQQPNAGSVSWTFESAYPAAWKTWFEQRFSIAGFAASRTTVLPGQSAADYTIACEPIDCSTPGGVGRVRVNVEGPRTDAEDIKLSISYGFADVGIR